jgi:hypothetical protein
VTRKGGLTCSLHRLPIPLNLVRPFGWSANTRMLNDLCLFWRVQRKGTVRPETSMRGSFRRECSKRDSVQALKVFVNYLKIFKYAYCWTFFHWERLISLLDEAVIT